MIKKGDEEWEIWQEDKIGGFNQAVQEINNKIKDLELQLEAKEWMKNLLTDCLESRAEKAEEERDYWRKINNKIEKLEK